ncbi:MAG TPA: RHS repeat-associated core domain-containing protein, partial [Verrucomicrobiae bacterium]|nr:RHS repeat-associated core domain-containing protein [Verrucomicrobiae bacterium]
VSTVNVTYDNLHRIKTYTGLSGSYGYNAVGTLSNSIEGGGSGYAFGVRRPQAVKSAFGYVYLYDLCGNMIVRRGGATNSQALVYDAENRLVRVAQASTNFLLVKFGYAGDGTRLWKWNNQSPTNLQVWIGNNYEEKNGKTLFHVFANGQQVCTFEAGSPLDGGSDTNKVGYYYTEDNLNSSSALSDSAGNQIEVDAYYPFGTTETASPQANFHVSRRFTGQIFDAEIGLYWYGWRIYVPELGRFGQADTEIPDLGNPQSYNRYSYVENCPLRYNDPTGHFLNSFGNWELAKYEQVGNFLNNAFVKTTVTVDPKMYYAGTGTVTPITENGKDVTAKLILQVATLPLTAVTMGPEREGGELLAGAIKGANVLKAGETSGNGIRAFKSFDALKRALGPAGDGNVWHHIVEQRAANVEKFGAEAIHNTENVVNVSRGVNQEIANYYSRVRPFTGGQTVRNWLGSQSYQQQMAFGRRILSQVVNKQPLP